MSSPDPSYEIYCETWAGRFGDVEVARDFYFRFTEDGEIPIEFENRKLTQDQFEGKVSVLKHLYNFKRIHHKGECIDAKRLIDKMELERQIFLLECQLLI